MAGSPLPLPTTPYSVNTFNGDGSTATREINFAGGYLRKEHVKAFQTSDTGVDTDVALTFIGPNTVVVSPVTPTGYVLTIYRDTPKDQPTVDFADGQIINEPNLDAIAQQAVFVAAEMVDRFGATSNAADEALTKAEQAIETADDAASDAAAAVTTANSASSTATTAINTANDVAAQFDELLETVEEIAGGDFSDFASRSNANTFAGANTFNQSPAVPTATSTDNTTKAASTAFVQGRATAVQNAAATDATTKANAAQSAAISAAAADATSKADAAYTAAVAQAGVLDTAKANSSNPVFTGKVKLDGDNVLSKVEDMGSSMVINVGTAERKRKVMSANGTFTITGHTAGYSEDVFLSLQLTGAFIPTFPASCVWYTPVPQWTAGYYLIMMTTFDDGATWALFGSRASV